MECRSQFDSNALKRVNSKKNQSVDLILLELESNIALVSQRMFGFRTTHLGGTHAQDPI